MPDSIGQHYVLLDSDTRHGGSMSTIRKGIDIRDSQFVAVKFITGPTDDLASKVFDRESRTLKSLTHKNIVTCRDTGIDESGSYYLVLDWVEQDLKTVLEGGPWASWDELCRDIALPIVDGLAYAHLKQIEHRDIKPQNILMTKTGTPLLADFGIAKIRGDEEYTSETVAAFHSRPYAPPEISSDIHYVRDIYSVGVLLLECLSPTTLRDLTDVQQALETVNIPPEARRLLASCVSVQPGDRPRNASELLSAIVGIQQKRKEKQAVARNPVLLRLTKAAVEHLTGDSNANAQAIAQMTGDLSGEVFGSFLIDKDSGAPNRSVLFLVGNEWKFNVRPDEDQNGCVVTAAARLEFEPLESIRRRSLRLPRAYNWIFRRGADFEQAQRGLATLLDSIDSFYEDIANGSVEGDSDREGDDLFDTWLRVLDAREDLARGEKEPLSYTKWRSKGRQATFKLASVEEHDLVNTEWRVKDQFTDRKFGYGEVIEHDGDHLVLLGSRWDGFPDKGLLVPHIGAEEATLGRQRDAVIAVRNGAAARPDLRDLLLDPSSSAPPKRAQVAKWGLDLDDTKKEAVQLALGAPDLFLVQGPPGTGKTSLIAETVDQCLRANPSARILIASQTNVAVDNALERLNKSGMENLVRLASADTSRVGDGVRHLLLDAQMKKWAQSVRRKADSEISSRAESASIPADHLRAALALQQLAATLAELDRLQVSAEAAVQEQSEASEFATSLNLSASASSIQEKVDALVDLRTELLLEAQTHLAGDLTLQTEMSAVDADAAVDVLLGDSPDAKGLLARLKLQAEWLQRISTDASLASTFLDQTNVIAGTCTGFLRHPAVRYLDIDLCIVDEASRATLTEALVPISRATKWIFVGDTNQLPPTDEDLLRSGDLLNEHQITRSDVTHTLFQRLANELPAHCQIMLSEQYRMIRPIGDMISTCFYDGKLRSPRESGLRGYDAVFGRPVQWIDTSGLGDRRFESVQQGKATSKANRGEAKLTIDQLLVLEGAIEKRVIQLNEDMEKLEVLVIAPYVSQVEELKQQLAPIRGRLNHLDVTVMSVDAVQGRESDIAFLSVTRSNLKGELGFLGADYWRRINVALSRARFGLTIVGDAGFIRGTSGALRDVLDYIQENPQDCAIKAASK